MSLRGARPAIRQFVRACKDQEGAIVGRGDDEPAGTGGGAPTPPGQPTGADAPFSGERIYSCDEGIPLVIRIDQSRVPVVASFSHDSSPEVWLVQVKPGSGRRFSNGKWNLRIRKRSAVLSQGRDFRHICDE